MASSSEATGREDAATPQTTPDPTLNRPPPTLLELNEYQLPYDIVTQILSIFIADGVKVSSHDQFESDMETIFSLVHTSREIRRETLRLMFIRPLFITVTSGCHQPLLDDCYIRGMSFLRVMPLIAKLWYFPLENWPEIRVQFAPCFERPAARAVTALVGHCAHCRANDPVSCIGRQSIWLATFLKSRLNRDNIPLLRDIQRDNEFLEGRARLDRDRVWRLQDVQLGAFSGKDLELNWNYKKPCYTIDKFLRCRILNPQPRITLSFEFKEAKLISIGDYEAENIPIWDFHQIVALLKHWRWSQDAERIDQIKLPSAMVCVGSEYDFSCLNRGTPLEYLKLHQIMPQQFASTLQRAFWKWWQESCLRSQSTELEFLSIHFKSVLNPADYDPSFLEFLSSSGLIRILRLTVPQDLCEEEGAESEPWVAEDIRLRRSQQQRR